MTTNKTAEGSLRILCNSFYLYNTSSWSRKWQPTPVLLPGKSQGQKSLVGYSPWGHKSRTRLRMPRHHQGCLVRVLLQVLLCRVWVFATTWAVALQAPLSMGFARQEYASGLPCSPPGHLPYPGIEPTSLASPALAGGFFITSTTREAHLSSELNWNHTFPWMVIFQLDIQLGVFVPLFFCCTVWPQYVWKAPWGFQGAALGWEALTGLFSLSSLSLLSLIPKLLLSNVHFWLENCGYNNNTVPFLWTRPVAVLDRVWRQAFTQHVLEEMDTSRLPWKPSG